MKAVFLAKGSQFLRKREYKSSLPQEPCKLGLESKAGQNIGARLVLLSA